MCLGEEGPLTKLKSSLLYKALITPSLFFVVVVVVFKPKLAIQIGDMLAQLPLLAFPGSLTIFLLSPISSRCKCSNRGAGDGEMRRGGDGGETARAYAPALAWEGKVKQETVRPSPSAARC